MKKVLLLISLAAAALYAGAADIILNSNSGKFTIDGTTGAVKKIADSKNRTVLAGSQNRYMIYSRKGDAVAFENLDKVVKSSRKNGKVVLVCNNSKAPDLIITKSYWVENNGLRRELSFTNQGKEKLFVLTMTDMNFAPEFKKGIWHLADDYGFRYHNLAGNGKAFCAAEDQYGHIYADCHGQLLQGLVDPGF